MGMKRSVSAVVVTLGVVTMGLLSMSVPCAAKANVQAEIDGTSAEPAQLPTPESARREAALRQLPVGGLLLIPESSNDRVMAFDPATGNLIDPDFIPSDPTNMSTPICAVLSADGTSVLVSDQINDVVLEYDLATGSYLGVFAPVGGADTSILDNIRGISLSASGNLLVSVGGGANADAIAEFDAGGNHVGNRVANGAGGLDSPFDVLVRATDLMVGGISSDACHQYDLSGTFIANFAAVNTFPEQISSASNGNLLIGNFSGTQEGVIELDSAGNVVGIYDPVSLGGYRGAYELPNGNILTTNSAGVHEIDRSGNLVETKVSGVDARFIEHVLEVAQEPRAVPGMTGTGAILLVLVLAAIGVVALRRVL